MLESPFAFELGMETGLKSAEKTVGEAGPGRRRWPPCTEASVLHFPIAPKGRRRRAPTPLPSTFVVRCPTGRSHQAEVEAGLSRVHDLGLVHKLLDFFTREDQLL